jgi:uncharacterized protein YggE
LKLEETVQKIIAILLGSLLACAILGAQTAPAIQATGNSTINATPDQAQLSIGVVTQGATAQEAGTLNATLSNTVQSALKSVLGTNGTIQTVGYSIYPRYSSGSTQTIVGYTASNTVQVTTTNLNIIGSLIDTANQAGANSVSGVSFGLQNPDPVLQQALTAATKQALAHAAAIASGSGLTTGAVISAQEGSSYTPVVTGTAPTASTTPIQTGTVGVSATVTVTVAVGAAH